MSITDQIRAFCATPRTHAEIEAEFKVKGPFGLAILTSGMVAKGTLQSKATSFQSHWPIYFVGGKGHRQPRRDGKADIFDGL